MYDYCYAHRVVDRAIDLLRGAGPRHAPVPGGGVGRAARTLPLSAAVPGPLRPANGCRGRPRFRPHPDDKPRLQRDYSAWLASARSTPEEYPRYYHKYYDCNSYADWEIGRLLDAVDRYCPDALVIYTSDHGDHLGAFGLCAKGPTMYDHTVAVPLVVAGPGLPAGLRTRSA